MTGPTGNSEFCFPSTSICPSASSRKTLRVLHGETKLTISFGASQSAYCIMMPIRSVLYYVSSIWINYDKNLGRDFKLKKRAARVISEANNHRRPVLSFFRPIRRSERSEPKMKIHERTSESWPKVEAAEWSLELRKTQ